MLSNNDTPDPRLIGLDNDNGILPLDMLQQLAGEIKPEVKPLERGGGAFPKPNFEVKKPKEEVKTASEPKINEEVNYNQDEVRILNQKISDMEAAIKLLVAGRDNVKLKAAAVERKPIDWNELSERDIFDLELPIEVVDHSMPDYMQIKLKDGNFVARWIQKMPRRLGPMRAMGWQFIMEDELEGELNIAIEPNVNGQLQFDDVIAMKLEKRIYYGMLRKNHLRALGMVSPKQAHQAAKARVISDMRSTEDGAGEFDSRVQKNQLDVYAPGFEI